MKYIRVIVSLGLIPLGVFIGSLFRFGDGNGVVVGFLIGFVLCCMINWLGSRVKRGMWSGSASLDEQHQDKQAIDATARNVNEVLVSFPPKSSPF